MQEKVLLHGTDVLFGSSVLPFAGPLARMQTRFPKQLLRLVV